MELIFNTLLKELKKCSKSQDVPVSALLIDKNNKIVTKCFNSRQKKYNFTNHAEIRVLNKMFKKTKNKNLSDYTLVTTLKPCLMCITVIEQSNITKVLYYLENIKCNYSRLETDLNFKKIGSDDEARTFEKELKDFFSNLRK
ncbi:nucleoside deaminase [Spiroplasma floricola]|uniref:tRNA-specific adenosine deaminase n=1 Tax=Spiroplasma floricola 23-6 TaxID=1336749 RepID=A0A2K8SC81_9MOLU|nr:nucleoside deaminase [Spiroplasma floricola]AUB31069.1 tRNA-specific adenosine deaminase [Spiroplasma floricola 23-6]